MGTASATPSVAIGGEEISLSISANSGYIFREWMVVNGGVTITDNKFTMPNRNVTIWAIFDKGGYNIVVQNDGNGSASARASAIQSEEITLTATPNDGYIFKEWQIISGGITITDNKFFMPGNDVTVKAIFEKSEYNIVVQNDGNGSASARASAIQGEEITLTATPNDGYIFKEWQIISGGITITDNKFFMPGNDVTVKAIFEKSEYNIIVQNDGNGSASARASATQGEEITLTATPNDGYIFKEWQIISGGITINDNKFFMPGNDVTVKAIFDAVQEISFNLGDFYTYTEIDLGYHVGLTASFKEQLNKASGGSLSSNNYTWQTGDPLPNPAPNGMYNGKPVVSMESLFMSCSAVKTLDLSKFVTDNVVNMKSMFEFCASLSDINLSSFNTENVTVMSYMFDGCASLTSIDLSMFNTAKVTDMRWMFFYCISLTSLDLSSFNTTNVINMGEMFNSCMSLTDLKINSFYTGNVINMGAMFSDCKSLTNLDLSNFSTKNTEYMNNMFEFCESLTNIFLRSFNTENVYNMSYMFDGCTALSSLDLSNFDTDSVVYMDYMFDGCTELTSLNLRSFNIDRVSSMIGMFNNCGKATNGIPAVGYAKNAETVEKFNNTSITKIDNSKLKFETGTNVEDEAFNAVKTLQIRGEQLFNPTESEVTIYNIVGRRIFVSKDKNINLSGLADGVYVASNNTESIKITKR